MLIFEQGFLQPVSFWTRKFKACQFFDSKFPPGVTIWKKFFTTYQILYEKVTTCHILIYKFYNVSNFASKFFPLVRFWFGIITMCLALKQKVYNVSFFESKLPYLVRFWIKIFTRCLILIDGNEKESDFELKTSKSVGFWKKFLSKVHVDFFSSAKWTFFAPFVIFKGMILKKKAVYIVSKFAWKKSQLVRFYIKCFTTCQILK